MTGTPKDKALEEAAVLLVVSKSPGHLGHQRGTQRGRLIPPEMKQMAIQLITEAVACGARSHKACGVLGISCRTLRRWSEPAHELSDRRGQAARGRIHPQALTPEEKQEIVQVCNTPEHASLPPSQIVYSLVDQGLYESPRV